MTDDPLCSKRWRALATVAVLLAAACSPSENQQAATAQKSICAHTKDISAGQLCAIQPSAVDSRTKDAGDTNLGFGFHVVAIPKGKVNGLWVHFTGSYGRPFNRGKYANEVWLGELLGQGYMVIQLAYDNAFNVNTDTCVGTGLGANRNNCAGEVRQEVITGEDVSPFRQTDQFNSIDFRLESLLAYLDANSLALPAGVGPQMDWSNVRVSGHSQGASMAYYIAKNRGVRFGCFLGGPFDGPDPVNPQPGGIADWFTTPPYLTLYDRLGALVATTDTNYRHFVRAYGIIGMTRDREWFQADQLHYTDGKISIDGHAAAVSDPALKELRAKACFRE